MSMNIFMPGVEIIYDSAGELINNTVGAWTFEVPNFSTLLTVEIWGGGGGSGPTGGKRSGWRGGDTTCTTLNMWAQGGEGGDNPTWMRLSHGGTASGGNKANVTGERGFIGGGLPAGGWPYGGAAHLGGGRDSAVPGGGGHGEIQYWEGGAVSGGGGGGGGYSRSEILRGDITPYSNLIGNIGGGGDGWWRAGARGGIKISWY